MKTIIRITLFIATIGLLAANSTLAQRVITGTVYNNGEPMAGVTVEAQRGSSMMTSFDGKYKVQADSKTKWLKFTFIDDSRKKDVTPDKDVYNFAFAGNIPSGDAVQEESGVNLKSQDELIKENNEEYMNELSMYQEFYKQEDYKSAMPHWENLYNKFPKSNLNIYIRGARMLKAQMNKATTWEEKDKILDQLMKLYDKRIKYFDSKGFVLGRKGADYLEIKLNPDRNLESDERTKALKTGYEWINESVTEQGNESEMPVLVLLIQTSNLLFKMGEIPKETMVKNYDKCNSIVKTAISENASADRVARAKEIQPVIESIFEKSGAADCETLVKLFTPQFKEKNNDVEFIKSMLARLRRTKCDQSDLYAQATERLYQLEPSAEAAFNMAHHFVSLNDIVKAKEYYKQAIEQETDKELLSTYYYEYATVLYAKDKNYPEARNYARKALDLKPDYCDALMLIGNIYIQARTSFGKDDFEKSTVFWVAVDYFNKARRYEDCAVDAAQKVSDYKKYFPDKEEAFFRNLKEGDTYKVGGWINETTKVRFNK
ncbi:MAG TPA: tetratricopeptide repeat protein [Draconibacterium sp.]|nr:tetratricopeptide repeat protein [Draconibacterium sp.]